MSLTVADVLALYMRHSQVEGLHGHAALLDRQRTFTVFAAQCGEMNVEAVKPYHLTDFIESHLSWRSVSTRRLRAASINAAFNWAVDQERIQRNPFKRIRYAESERRPDLPDREINRIADLANKPFDRVMRFLRLTGCRLGELCAATWEDVDLDRGIWTIHRHKSRGKTRKAKMVALVEEAVAMLRVMAWAPAGEPHAIAVSVMQANVADPVFRNTQGRPWKSGTLSRHMCRLKRRHKLGTATLHGIRHRFASAAVANGAPMKLVSVQLGHSSSAITEKYYVDLTGEMDAIRAAAELACRR